MLYQCVIILMLVGISCADNTSCYLTTLQTVPICNLNNNNIPMCKQIISTCETTCSSNLIQCIENIVDVRNIVSEKRYYQEDNNTDDNKTGYGNEKYGLTTIVIILAIIIGIILVIVKMRNR